jgi:hypothetical protein
MQTLTYQDAARQLLAQSFEELSAGNARQASGKGWEATAQMIKAVAADRGWEHDDTAALYRVISRLVKETGDDDIRRRFGVANALHLNFNENWGSADYVAGQLAYLRELLDKLERLLDHDTTP